MITALSLNPSIDRTLTVPKFTYGGLNRVSSEKQDAGGKGVNVSLVLRALNCDVCCAGFLHRETSPIFAKKLSVAGADYDFVFCPGATRTNLKILDAAAGIITEINQSGRPVSPEELAQMTEIVRKHARESSMMVLSGSMPPGCPADYYEQLIRICREAGCRCILDADGEKLAHGLKAAPFLIKPNRYELEQLTGRSLKNRREILAAARELISGGVSVVAVSLGAEGAMIVDKETALYAPPLPLQVNSTVGAGDSMVAGLAAAFDRGDSLEEAFRTGVAAASAACLTEGTQPFTLSQFEDCRRKVAMEYVR